MADYDDLIKIAGNSGFQDRIKYALTQAAVSVYNESSSTTGHLARLAYATGIIGGSYNLAPAALAVLTNTTIATEATLGSAPDFAIPDTDIQFAVNSLWNALANA
jgi:hypothetical protein